MTPAPIPQATVASTLAQGLPKTGGRRSRTKGRNQGAESKADHAEQEEGSPGEDFASYLGQIGNAPFLTAAEEAALAFNLRSALEAFLRHIVGSLAGIEKILEMAAQTRPQKKAPKASGAEKGLSCIEEDCRTELAKARHALASRGWVTADVTGRLKDSALKLALELKIRVIQFI